MPKTSNRKRLDKINKRLHAMGTVYHDAIPLDRIQHILDSNGFLTIQEDGTEWSGFLLGAEGRAVFELCDLDTSAGYYYLRHDGEAVDAVRIPTNGSSWDVNGDVPLDANYVQEPISRAEYDTFHAMGCQTVDVYDETSMRYSSCSRTLCLSWYKMGSGRYEITAYVS